MTGNESTMRICAFRWRTVMSFNEGHDAVSHPNPMDRNRSIMWARYHIDSDDWILLSMKVTRRDDEAGKSRPSIVSIAVTDHSGKAMYEAMVRSAEIVSNEEIALHGVNQSVVFNAKPYSEVRESLLKLLAHKALVTWDSDYIQKTFNELDSINGFAATHWKADSAAREFARFVGERSNPSATYVSQPLPLPGVSASDECRSIVNLIKEMAGSSQVSDQVASGKPGWTAEFYKPRVNTADKIKGFFGLD